MILRRTQRFPLCATLVGVALVLTACAPSSLEQGAVGRGDQAWARGDTEEALAEYRLAVQTGDRSGGTLVRLSHAYAQLDQVDDAKGSYEEAVAMQPAFADQAAADMILLARRARDRGDRFGMATAVNAARGFRPGVSAQDLALPLARHFAELGEFGQALPRYEEALASVVPDSAPELVYETALAYEELGDCLTGLVHFEMYRELIPRWRRGEVDWHIGNCSFQMASELWDGVPEDERGLDSEDEREALRLLETTINLREPRNRLAAAFFRKGEILSLRGECDAAVDAFRRVVLEDPSGTSPLVGRARQRIDEIRFGSDEGSRRPFWEREEPTNPTRRGCG
jgi:tetratricopeptide (TPR) repeat protein